MTYFGDGNWSNELKELQPIEQPNKFLKKMPTKNQKLDTVESANKVLKDMLSERKYTEQQILNRIYKMAGINILHVQKPKFWTFIVER